jgi:hypothetical protein
MAALQCIQERDPHAAADLIDIVGGIIHAMGENQYLKVR